MIITVELILVLAVLIFGAVNGLVIFRDSVNRGLLTHAKTLDDLTQASQSNALKAISASNISNVSAANLAAHQHTNQSNNQSVNVTVYAGGQDGQSIPPSP